MAVISKQMIGQFSQAGFQNAVFFTQYIDLVGLERYPAASSWKPFESTHLIFISQQMFDKNLIQLLEKSVQSFIKASVSKLLKVTI